MLSIHMKQYEQVVDSFFDYLNHFQQNHHLMMKNQPKENNVKSLFE
jgi:hypothetical protein